MKKSTMKKSNEILAALGFIFTWWLPIWGLSMLVKALKAYFPAL